jgi:hypothetical protein
MSRATDRREGCMVKACPNVDSRKWADAMNYEEIAFPSRSADDNMPNVATN